MAASKPTGKRAPATTADRHRRAHIVSGCAIGERRAK